MSKRKADYSKLTLETRSTAIPLERAAETPRKFWTQRKMNIHVIFKQRDFRDREEDAYGGNSFLFRWQAITTINHAKKALFPSLQHSVIFQHCPCEWKGTIPRPLTDHSLENVKKGHLLQAHNHFENFEDNLSF